MRTTSRFLLALILALPCAAALHAADAPASSGPLGEALAGKRILHIAAHPDDETLFAPMMAEACRFNGGTCRLVVALRGNGVRFTSCLITLAKQGSECTLKVDLVAELR